MKPIESLFLIAGSGDYPGLVIGAARSAGVRRVVLAAFDGETSRDLDGLADEVYRMKVGQLGKLLEAAQKSGA
ncbi:MAG: DUF1009 domain-containing protein, partial [Verrucomicrobiae bacterium]